MEQPQTETNYFASMTDMMVGILFIFVIMIAFFAFQASDTGAPYLSVTAKQPEIFENKKFAPFLLSFNTAATSDTAVELSYTGSAQPKGVDFDAISSVLIPAGVTEYILNIPLVDDPIFEGDETLVVNLKSVNGGGSLIDSLRRQAVMIIKDDDQLKPNPLESHIKAGSQARDKLVEDIITTLRSEGIDARSVQQGVVTISGKGLFASGRSDLDSVESATRKVDIIGRTLAASIECFTLSAISSGHNKECNPDKVFLESVFVEGHTDNIQVTRTLIDGSKTNLELSSRRATNTYERMVASESKLTEFINPNDQQILSVAAYGEQRPIDDNMSAQGRENNRRIDIRFVMYVPLTVEQLNQLKARVGGT